MKPGIKTSEFIITAAVVLFGFLVASGLLPESNPIVQGLAALAAAIAPAAYSASRALVKSADIKAEAIKSVPK